MRYADWLARASGSLARNMAMVACNRAPAVREMPCVAMFPTAPLMLWAVVDSWLGRGSHGFIGLAFSCFNRFGGVACGCALAGCVHVFCGVSWKSRAQNIAIGGISASLLREKRRFAYVFCKPHVQKTSFTAQEITFCKLPCKPHARNIHFAGASTSHLHQAFRSARFATSHVRETSRFVAFSATHPLQAPLSATSCASRIH